MTQEECIEHIEVSYQTIVKANYVLLLLLICIFIFISELTTILFTVGSGMIEYLFICIAFYIFRNKIIDFFKNKIKNLDKTLSSKKKDFIRLYLVIIVIITALIFYDYEVALEINMLIILMNLLYLYVLKNIKSDFLKTTVNE